MRTIVDIIISKPKRAPAGGGVMIPVGMHVSDDDSDDEEMPVLEFSSIGICLTDETLNKGQSAIVEALDEVLFDHRDNFGAVSFHKMRNALIDFVANNDLTSYANPWIPEPDSETVH